MVCTERMDFDALPRTVQHSRLTVNINPFKINKLPEPCYPIALTFSCQAKIRPFTKGATTPHPSTTTSATWLQALFRTHLVDLGQG